MDASHEEGVAALVGPLDGILVFSRFGDEWKIVWRTMQTAPAEH